MARDMTQKQFDAALARYGMRDEGFAGYVNINVPCCHVMVSKLNAGTNRRAQLAYLLRKRDEHISTCKRDACEAVSRG